MAIDGAPTEGRPYNIFQHETIPAWRLIRKVDTALGHWVGDRILPR